MRLSTFTKSIQALALALVIGSGAFAFSAEISKPVTGKIQADKATLPDLMPATVLDKNSRQRNTASNPGDPPLVRTDTHIVINIPSRQLWVYHGDDIYRFFPVGVGRNGFITPIGEFHVLRKVINPGWENPYLASGKVRIAPGGNNPLGTRWIGFYRRGTGEYGIHGTDTPSSIGKFTSHGCIRMQVKDAETVFDMVDIGTPVEVWYKSVLVRREKNTIRIVVYGDPFHKGMPTADAVVSDILKQYPGTTLNTDAITTALQTPDEHFVDVGVAPPIVVVPKSKYRAGDIIPPVVPNREPKIDSPAQEIESGNWSQFAPH